MIGFKGVGSFEETVRAGIADLFVPSVLVLAPRDLDEYFQSRTGLTVAHFLQFHTYCGLLQFFLLFCLNGVICGGGDGMFVCLMM